MINMTSCSCIIPFYNEENRIISVLTELFNVEEFDEFVLINDWSTDKWGEIVKNFIKGFKKVKYIQYDQNQWKSYAVKQWLDRVESNYVFFFDADLQWVKKEEVQRVIKSLYCHPEVDTWILRRIYTKWYVRIFMVDLLLSWQRMLKTVDAKRIFEWEISWYQMEIAINTYMYYGKKYWVRYPFSAENTFKKEKYWFFKWLKREIRMYQNIFRYCWFLRYVKISANLWFNMIKSYEELEE
jgi:glycosyltransferase involved in cell wall biosynthesis